MTQQPLKDITFVHCTEKPHAFPSETSIHQSITHIAQNLKFTTHRPLGEVTKGSYEVDFDTINQHYVRTSEEPQKSFQIVAVTSSCEFFQIVKSCDLLGTLGCAEKTEPLVELWARFACKND